MASRLQRATGENKFVPGRAFMPDALALEASGGAAAVALSQAPPKLEKGEKQQLNDAVVDGTAFKVGRRVVRCGACAVCCELARPYLASVFLVTSECVPSKP